MSRFDPDDLLRELAQIEEGDASHPPTDEELAAYRAGELGPGDADRVEAALAESPAARKRLIGLARMRLPIPPDRIRDRVLAGFTERRRPQPTRFWFLAAAAALAAVIGGALFLQSRAALPAYDIGIAGSAEMRSGEPGLATRQAAAEPGQPVVVTVNPVESGEPDVVFALYRLTGDHLRRVEPGAGFDRRRGEAVLKAPAEEIAGESAPGTYRLFVVTARPGKLPSAEVILPPGDDPQSALSGPGRNAYPLHLQILAPAEAAPP